MFHKHILFFAPFAKKKKKKIQSAHILIVCQEIGNITFVLGLRYLCFYLYLLSAFFSRSAILKYCTGYQSKNQFYRKKQKKKVPSKFFSVEFFCSVSFTPQSVKLVGTSDLRDIFSHHVRPGMYAY